jgi:dTDP-4-amino-4,6-dideoxygalactose transaminase
MIKLAKPFLHETAIDQIAEILRSGNLVQGQFVGELESSLAKYLDVKHAIVVSSGTAALHLSLMALDIKEGDEVIVPAFTFPATANVVEIVGARPVLVDISLNDFCMDTSALAKIVTDRTKAIMPVHEFGQAADMDMITTMAAKHNLLVIEDAACALGTEYNRQKAGTFGIAGCFSFHPRKAITTGEGGTIVTGDGKLAAKLRCLRNHGISFTEGKQDFIHAGLNYRMTDFQAVLGIHQLRDIESIIVHRERLALAYDRALSGIPGVTAPARLAERRHVYQTYHILLADGIDRNSLIAYLKREGVETNIGAQAIHCTGYYKNKYRYAEHDYPNAAKAFRQGLALPMGMHIGESDVEFIAAKLEAFIVQP